MPNVYDELERRGLIAQSTDPGLRDVLAKSTMTVYAGFDPTADSLHLGHIVPVFALSHFQRHGHKVIIVVGGATGMVGDPSGRSSERNLLTPQQVQLNAEAVRTQMKRFLQFDGPNAAILVDNNDWIAPMSFIDWLREVGKYFTINYMLDKDSVKLRLGSSQGISFTEFSYMTMQAYDFWWLNENKGCNLQVGGNDQFGNITAGIEYIRKKSQKSTYGITFPLITTAAGEKFGKSLGNAVWLDAGRTSPYQLYQYLLNTDDRDVERLLKIYTWIPVDEIEELCREHSKRPEARTAQQRLAQELVRIIHGAEAVAQAVDASQLLFKRELTGLGDSEIAKIFADSPSIELPAAPLDAGYAALDLLAASGLCSSKSEARRLIEGGGAYLNNKRIADVHVLLRREDLGGLTTVVLRSGSKRVMVVRFK